MEDVLQRQREVRDGEMPLTDATHRRGGRRNEAGRGRAIERLIHVGDAG